MKLHKYTLPKLKEAVATSSSKRQVLQKLNVVPAGGNYATLRKAFQHFNIDTSHFKGQAWSKGKKFSPKRPIEDYLSNKVSCQSNRLKKRLIKEGYLEARCAVCKITSWNNKPLSLELDHIDGNHLNNNLQNLRILCPNCHSQTPTHRGKNKGSYKS